MKKWNQFGLLLSPLGILIAISLLWSFAIRPQIIGFIRNQIPVANQAQQMVELAVTDIDVSLLKLQLSIGKINIQFKQKFQDLNPIEVKRVRLKLDPFKLLVGQVSVSKIQVDQINWNFENRKTGTSALSEIPVDALFRVLPQIPIDQIHIYNSQINFTDRRLNLDLGFNVSHLQLQNKKNSLGLVVRRLKVLSNGAEQSAVQAEMDLNSTLNNTKDGATLEVPHLKLQALDSMIQLSGRLTNFKQVVLAPEGDLKIQSEIHFDDLRTLALSLFPQKSRMPAMTGNITTTGQLKFKSLNDFNGELSVQTKQVSVDHFKLGQAQMRAVIKKNQIFINQIEVEHPSAIASLKQIEIEQKPPYHFKATAQVKQFDLQKLFLSIGLTEIPAGLNANGNSQCSGLIQPEFKLNCEVSVDLQDIWVRPSQKATLSIAKLKKASLNGQVQLDRNGLNYKMGIRVGESTGSSEGKVLFAEGFKLNFETEKLNFSDVESLADLNFKGLLKIKGTTSGDTSRGIIDADVVFTNGEIDQFKIGRVDAKIKYEKGNLYLKQMNGLMGRSTYQGDIQFDFNKSILAAGLDFKVLYGEDIIASLKERFGIAFSLFGRGQARVDLTGPFDFWKLKYVLKAHLNQGQFAEEGFDQLQIDLKADGDAIHFDQVYLKKYKSRLQFQGEINTTQQEPQFALRINARPLYLEELDHVVRLAPNFSGQAWIEGKVLGPIENPELSFNFNAKQISFENNEYPGSQGFVAINRKNFRFNGQLFGRQIQSDLLWPWNENDPYAIRLQVRDLNPLMLLPTISIPQPSTEFYSRINADIDLKSNHRNLKSSEGSVRISDFMLQRGALYMKLNRPSTMTFKNGLTQMEPIELRGESNSLQVNLVSSNQIETKLAVAGDIQLRQFQFLTPFAQSLSGRLQVDSQIVFRGNDFELLGDGEITDGLISLKGFPQAIENINTPLEFSRSKILLNDISAQLGSSEITGHGQVDIKGAKHVNVNLQASTDNIELTFPEKITTAGKADLVFFGSWLPYTMKVNYKVARGLVEKDFGQDSSQGKTSVRLSPYLPPQQIEKQSPSLLLDIAIDLSQGIVVKNQLLEGEASGKLNITGTPENPIFAGQINITPGSKLIFKDKPFDIQTATIKFPGTAEINPEVYMTANARVSDYDISLLVQGVPSKNLSIKPTSQPPLTEPDIFSLLALGLTSKTDQNLSSETQQKQTGLEVLAAISNQSTINKKFQEKFGLTLQLAPTVDSTKNIAVPKVVVSKKIQKNVNASYSRPLTGDTQNQEWKLQYLFNPNKSIILNYQNVESSQQETKNPNANDQGILGLDFEYKKEFK